MSRWTRSPILCLEGSALELHPEFGSDLWFVVDRSEPGTGLRGPLPLREAKRAAERIQAEIDKADSGQVTFAYRLREARRQAGLTQAEVAARAGLEPAAVSHYETGEREPSLANLELLIGALGCDAGELVKQRRRP